MVVSGVFLLRLILLRIVVRQAGVCIFSQYKPPADVYECGNLRVTLLRMGYCQQYYLDAEVTVLGLYHGWYGGTTELLYLCSEGVEPYGLPCYGC